MENTNKISTAMLFMVDGEQINRRELIRRAAKMDASFGNDLMQTCRAATNVLRLQGIRVIPIYLGKEE